jgi:hypothetical protein
VAALQRVGVAGDHRVDGVAGDQGEVGVVDAGGAPSSSSPSLAEAIGRPSICSARISSRSVRIWAGSNSSPNSCAVEALEQAALDAGGGAVDGHRGHQVLDRDEAVATDVAKQLAIATRPGL